MGNPIDHQLHLDASFVRSQRHDAEHLLDRLPLPFDPAF